MKVYVASKFENAKEVREAHAALKADGHEITHDWTWEDASEYHGDELIRYLQECAEKDRYGVESADAILLINYARCAGAFTELGLAIAYQKFIVVIDAHHPEKARNIFFYLPKVVHADDLAHARVIFRLKEGEMKVRAG